MQKLSTNARVRVRTSKVAGDKGLYSVPVKLQGKWYNMDKNRRAKSESNNQLTEIEFGKHTLKTDDSSYEIHVPDKEYFEKHQKFSDQYLNDTHTWVKAFNSTEQLKGVNYITLFGWTVNSGYGTSYGYTILDGQPVVILANGEGKWTNQVYWKTPELAKKHQDQNFDKLVTEAENN